jgi:hypothetical protein
MGRNSCDLGLSAPAETDAAASDEAEAVPAGSTDLALAMWRRPRRKIMF